MLIVILLFLQDWRAVLVPATTVPVTIIGAFAGMALFGFSVNLLTLFGLVLAIGIVVDDAIVIVENAAHHIEPTGWAPREATIRAMDEVTGPVIGITLVLMAVFLPTAFLGGITGQLYRQFALTIAIDGGDQRDQRAHAEAGAVRRVAAADSPERATPSSAAFNAVYARAERALRTARVLDGQRDRSAMMVVFAVLIAVTLWASRRCRPASCRPRTRAT